jgi:hypothetical protein
LVYRRNDQVRAPGALIGAAFGHTIALALAAILAV